MPHLLKWCQCQKLSLSLHRCNSALLFILEPRWYWNLGIMSLGWKQNGHQWLSYLHVMLDSIVNNFYNFADNHKSNGWVLMVRIDFWIFVDSLRQLSAVGRYQCSYCTVTNWLKVQLVPKHRALAEQKRWQLRWLIHSSFRVEDNYNHLQVPPSVRMLLFIGPLHIVHRPSNCLFVHYLPM